MPTIEGEKREGQARLRSRGGIPVYEETYHYLVLADSIAQTRDEIILTDGLPEVSETTSAGGFAVCVALYAVRRENSVLYWDVTAEFSSEVDEQSTGATNPGANPPEAWVPIYETKFERYQRVVVEDESGNKFLNSVNQPFETGLTVTRHIPIWEFFQFEPATVTDEQVIDRSETVNQLSFRGRAAKTLLCVVLSSVIGRYYGQLRRLTLYQLKYNEDDWRLKMLDVGTSHYNNGATKVVPYNVKIVDGGDYTVDNMELVLGPLDGTGQPTGGYDGATDFAVMDGTEPNMLYFDQYRVVDFHTFLRT